MHVEYTLHKDKMGIVSIVLRKALNMTLILVYFHSFGFFSVCFVSVSIEKRETCNHLFNNAPSPSFFINWFTPVNVKQNKKWKSTKKKNFFFSVDNLCNGGIFGINVCFLQCEFRIFMIYKLTVREEIRDTLQVNLIQNLQVH